MSILQMPFEFKIKPNYLQNNPCKELLRNKHI